MIPIVPHRMGGLHARKDPLLDEKPGSVKRKKASDGSDLVVYKETAAEKVERLAKDKKEQRAAKKAAEKIQVTDEAAPAAKRQKAQLTTTAATVPTQRGAGIASAAAVAMQGQLASFKDRLKGSALPAEAEAAEKKRKDEFAAEIQKSSTSASSTQPVSGEQADSKPAVEDPDNPISFSDIWKEGDEASTSDWLSGQGLKFHTTADKAFAMDSRRFKEAIEGNDGAENREALAEQARRRGEAKMAEFKYSKGASALR